MKKVILLCAALALALAVAGTAIAQDSAGGSMERPQRVDPAPGGSLSGNTIVTRGSDTTFAVTDQLGELFTFANSSNAPFSAGVMRNENPNGDIVLNQPPDGSSIGIAQLADYADLVNDNDSKNDRQTAVARSSREPRSSDPAGLQFTAFATDGIVVTTFGAQGGPSEGIENLSFEQVRDIFVTCEITNYNQIGGDDAEIEVYAIQEGSGTRATFDAFVGGDSSSCADEDNIIFENNANPILENDGGVDPADRGRAIFPFSFARLSTSVPSDAINVLSLDGVQPNGETIGDGSYRFSRDVFLVTVANNARGDDPAGNRAADRFVNFVCKPNSAHSTDPRTGDNFGEVIDNTILANGFGLLENGGCANRPVTPAPAAS